MGDRCYLRMTIPKLDRQFWEEQLGIEDIEDEEETMISFATTDVNYGATDLRQEAAQAGKVFYGSHSEGCEYEPFLFASDGKRSVDVPFDWHDLPQPTAKVAPDGTVDARDIKNAMRYYRILKRAERLIHGPKRKANGRRHDAGK